jgi:hypothetical protein
MRCNGEIIDQRAKPKEVGNILAVSQFLAGLRYNEQWLFDFFGGKEVMIESPYLNEIVREQVDKRMAHVEKNIDRRVAEELSKKVAEELPKRMRRAIERALKSRFGDLPADIAALTEKVTDDDELDSLNAWAGTCHDLDAFRQKLAK